MNINEVLNNPNNIYHGHGTGTDSFEVLNSIMNNGLRCSHGSLYYTSIVLGNGNAISDATFETMKHWPHKSSPVVVVVSLPAKFRILEGTGIGTYGLGDAAYYYVPDEMSRKKYGLTNANYVMPEFVAGYYDANTDTFISNPKYYENLSQDRQNDLFNKIKQNYYNVIADNWENGIEDYKEITQELGWDFPLTDEEVEHFKNVRASYELMASLGDEVLNKPLLLPNGVTIPAKQYIEEIVLQAIPAKGYVVMNNGNKIPVSHFIMECVLYDCQERYNGDFSKYLQENVNLEETMQINSTKEDDNKIKR